MLTAGCMQSSSNTAEEVCTALSDKYGEEFQAVSIGDRIDTNHSKLYVHPISNEEVLFTAVIDDNTGKITDNYIVETVNLQIKDKLKENCKKKGIETEARVMAITRNGLEINTNKKHSPESFMKEYDLNNYLVYLIAKQNDITTEEIKEVIKKTEEELNIKMLVVGYILDEGYDECSEEMKKYPEISKTMIESYNPVASFDYIPI